jgi:hypothetical protein
VLPRAAAHASKSALHRIGGSVLAGVNYARPSHRHGVDMLPDAPLFRARRLAWAALLLAPLAASATGWSGRWEGTARIPGAPLQMVIDLAQDGAGWHGSAILPGHDVSGVPLRDLVVTDETLRASLAAAFPNGALPDEPLLLLRRSGDDRVSGELQQGGHTASLALARSGAAQVAMAPANTAIDPSLAGVWQGSYELGGYARQVTLTLKAGPPSADAADLLIVGRRTAHLLLDRVSQGSQFLVVESSEQGLTIEGRWRTASGDIEATFRQGPFEVPLVLHRAKARS